MQPTRCANDNHGRTIVTVRHCCTCGALLNARIGSQPCADEKHARMRRSQHAFCMDCGDRLVAARGGEAR